MLSTAISLISLCVSVGTAYLALFRRGTVLSTHPSFIAFRYDFVGRPQPQAKISLRTLLFSTGKRGLVIESLFLRVREGARSEEFSVWGYGGERGSGLFVGENGVVANHHFNPINTEEFFKFTPGTYDLELVAKLINRDSLVKLSRIALTLPSGAFDDFLAPRKRAELGRGIIPSDVAVFFNWSPEQTSYVTAIEKRNTLLEP